jgi:PhoH-like ATPase
MKKNYILDTNVLLYDPKSILVFGDNNIYIPLVVLEELDVFKKKMNDLGQNAREIIRKLDGLRKKGRLNEGVALPSGGKLFVMPFKDNSVFEIDKEYADNKLLYISHYLKNEIKEDGKVILITKDINLRVKADALGIDCEDYKRHIEGEKLYTGHIELEADKEIIDELYEEKTVKMKSDGVENQYVILKANGTSNQSALAKFKNKNLVLMEGKTRAISIKPKNVGQKFALDALMDPDLKLVVLNGKSGTGKTLMTIASALHGVQAESLYEKITVTRPVVPVGEDIGYLPGSISEKLDPWMKPIHDALYFIIESDKRKNNKTEIPATFEADSVLQIAPLNYIRGRSIANSFMVVDESQNLTPLEVKTIITRVGQGTKIVFTGDINQIDHPYLNKNSNGLAYLIRKFKGQKLFATVTLTEGERSELAEIAANIL